MTMKKTLCLTVFLVYLVSVINSWGIGAEVAHWVSKNRIEKGLEPIAYSETLAITARRYCEMMLAAGAMTHSLSLPSEKLAMVNGFADVIGERYRLDDLYIYELLYTEYTERDWITISPEYVSHVFDDFPRHAWGVYHEDAMYMGWAMIKGPKLSWVTAYIAIKGTDNGNIRGTIPDER